MTKDVEQRNKAHDETCSVPGPRPNSPAGIWSVGFDSIGATVVNTASTPYWNLHTWNNESNRNNYDLDCLFGRANPSTRPKFDINAIGCEE